MDEVACLLSQMRSADDYPRPGRTLTERSQRDKTVPVREIGHHDQNEKKCLIDYFYNRVRIVTYLQFEACYGQLRRHIDCVLRV